MVLPFKPATWQANRQRYWKAVEKTHDTESVQLGVAIAPGAIPENVFDFADGLRLIVSRELVHTTGKVVIHFSASLTRGLPLYEKAMGLGPGYLPELLDLVVDRWRYLSRDKTSQPEFLGVSPEKGTPHWILELA